MTFVVILVLSQKFSSADATPSSSMFDKPSLLSKRKPTHGCGAGVLVDGSDQYRGKAGLTMPVGSCLVGKKKA